jgi:glucokinase
MTSARPLPSDAKGRHALGIDVGGTKIAGGIVDLVTGEITARRQVPTEYQRGGAAILADTVALAHDLKRAATQSGLAPVALGVGVAELVDRTGRVFSDHRIRWTGLDVAGQLGAVLPTVVSADVRAAALAEARFGAGRGLRDFYYVTIGTGVAGVLVLNGQPYAGSRGAALVIANSMERHRCAACGHVTTGMVEDAASGPGLVAAYGKGGQAEDVLAAAAQGDAAALHAIAHATGELGRVLALLVDSLDPQAMVIGGGLGSAPGPYFDALARAIRAGLWDGVPNPLPITRAALGPDAGLIGAACATVHQPERADQPPIQMQ